MRVLFVIPGMARGNSMIFARRQAVALGPEGVAVDLFHLRTRTSPRGLLEAFFEFRKAVARSRPQVIHAHFGTMTAMFAALAAPELPLVITYRGGDLNPVPPAAPRQARIRSLAGRLMSQCAALRADRIVCVSGQLRSRLWWRRARARVLPSGVDLAQFFPQPQAIARQRLGWGAAEVVVLFNAGGSGWIKRPELAHAAAEWARQTIPELRLEVIDGSREPAEVPWLMNAADCLLLTSATEGSPTVVQEAMACGLPVVAVRVGDTVERLAAAEPDHPGSSGGAINRLADDTPQALGTALSEVLRLRNRRCAPANVANFSASTIAIELRKIYSELVSIAPSRGARS